MWVSEVLKMGECLVGRVHLRRLEAYVLHSGGLPLGYPSFGIKDGGR